MKVIVFCKNGEIHAWENENITISDGKFRPRGEVAHNLSELKKIIIDGITVWEEKK